MARILIIDDHAALLDGIARFLRAAGHEVHPVASGREALARFDTLSVDLVITDLNMPEMDGIEVITTLQASAPGVPVVAMSGGGLLPKELLLGNAGLLGAVEAIEKPFDLKELLDVVDLVLASAADESTLS